MRIAVADVWLMFCQCHTLVLKSARAVLGNLEDTKYVRLFVDNQLDKEHANFDSVWHNRESLATTRVPSVSRSMR
jgi:hypothetical protein